MARVRGNSGGADVRGGACALLADWGAALNERTVQRSAIKVGRKRGGTPHMPGTEWRPLGCTRRSGDKRGSSGCKGSSRREATPFAVPSVQTSGPPLPLLGPLRPAVGMSLCRAGGLKLKSRAV